MEEIGSNKKKNTEVLVCDKTPRPGKIRVPRFERILSKGSSGEMLRYVIGC